MLLVLGLAFTFVADGWADSKVEWNASKEIPVVGYGVRDLVVSNPISSCTTVAPSQASVSKPITIYFLSNYSASQNAKGKFLHDGWHYNIHPFESKNLKYSWKIYNQNTMISHGILSDGNSITYVPMKAGPITVKCQVTCEATPVPSYASVGITQWTKTAMPVLTFGQKAEDVTIMVTKGETTIHPDPVEVKEEESPMHFMEAYVEHTPAWDKRRTSLNTCGKDLSKTPTLDQYLKEATPRPRYDNVFWIGEKLILEADTDEDAIRVSASARGTDYSTSLTKEEGRWVGSLWTMSMLDIIRFDKPYDITLDFTSTYKDGTTATDSVTIILWGNIYSDILHRVI